MIHPHCTTEQPTLFPIKEIKNDNALFKTFVFAGNIDSKPGQFVMLWLPGVEMKPFSISKEEDGFFEITIMQVGAFTKALFELKAGDMLGIQGPYGRPFTLKDLAEKVVLVGGGCGIAPLIHLAFFLKNQPVKTYFIAGCRQKDLLIKEEPIKKLSTKSYFVSNDGSLGEKGYPTDKLKELLATEKIDQIFACGPEPMLVPLARIAVEKEVPCQISVERFMQCGIGICGQCSLDDSGLRVCHEGPVFEAQKLLESPEFGKYKRDKRGRISN
jgi:dihydroorotate dehydrogenase electron transfer subunit